MKQILRKFILTSVILTSTFAVADELHLTKQQALKLGYQATQLAAPTRSRTTELTAHSLPWPVQFVDAKHTIGNSMAEYQNYAGEAYYHEGSDLRVSPKGAVVAPVDGFLQGDYYSYVTDPNTGEDTKYTKPISEGGEDLYFELTIRTEDGYQFELHHVNAKTLPKNIHDLAVKGGGQVKQGETIGYASLWPMNRLGARYDHIHYNLISPTGVYLNHEYYSADLPDASAPVIKKIFAIYPNQKVEVLNHKLSSVPQEIVVSTYDMKGANMYQLPPTFIELSWNQIEKVGWDFTRFLLTSLGKYPDLRDVYASRLVLSDGRQFSTLGDYNDTEFLLRLKVPSSATLPFTLTVKDVSGNQTVVQLGN